MLCSLKRKVISNTCVSLPVYWSIIIIEIGEYSYRLDIFNDNVSKRKQTTSIRTAKEKMSCRLYRKKTEHLIHLYKKTHDKLTNN